MEARERDLKRGQVGDLPFGDIDADNNFLREHEVLVDAAARAIGSASVGTQGATDADIREALDALVQTYKTLSSGIYYDVKPDSSFARTISETVKERVEEFRKAETEQSGLTQTRDSDVMKAMVFWLHAATVHDNGKPKGRAFLSLLVNQFGAADPAPTSVDSQLIVPGG